MKSFLISENDAAQRLDKFLSKSVPLLPKSLLYKSIRKKRIKVNGRRAELSYRLEKDDRVDLYLNDDLLQVEVKETFLQVSAQIEVVFENDHLLLVNKPQGMVVHEDNENTADTLIHRVLHYLYEKGDYLPEKETSFIPALCNRLDRNTCGIVIVAKTAAALRLLNQKIKDQDFEKRYLCIVRGTPKPSHATITHYLEKQAQDNLVKVYNQPNPRAKTATMSYRVLETKGELCLIEVQLHTGRTHQIRAQMAHIGHPVLGDGKYGNGVLNKKYRQFRQLLCAYQLTVHFEANELFEELDQKTFTIPKIWFVEDFHKNSL